MGSIFVLITVVIVVIVLIVVIVVIIVDLVRDFVCVSLHIYHANGNIPNTIIIIIIA